MKFVRSTIFYLMKTEHQKTIKMKRDIITNVLLFYFIISLFVYLIIEVYAEKGL